MIETRTKRCLSTALIALCLSGAAWAQDDAESSARERAEARRAVAEQERGLAETRRALEEAAREVARLSAEIARPVIGDIDVQLGRFGGRAQLGVNVEDAENGARVISVTPGSGAADAGIVTGDVITSIDGVTLAQGGGRGPGPAQVLLRAMRDVEPDQGVLLRVLRDDEVHELTVLPRVLERGNAFVRGPGPAGGRAFDIELPDLSDLPRILTMPGMFSRPFRELELVSLTPALGAYFGTEQGLLVVRAPQHEQIELEDGDVILDIGGRTPTSPEHAMRILASFEPGETLRLTIMRRQRRETLEFAIPGSADAA